MSNLAMLLAALAALAALAPLGAALTYRGGSNFSAAAGGAPGMDGMGWDRWDVIINSRSFQVYTTIKWCFHGMDKTK